MGGADSVYRCQVTGLGLTSRCTLDQGHVGDHEFATRCTQRQHGNRCIRDYGHTAACDFGAVIMASHSRGLQCRSRRFDPSGDDYRCEADEGHTGPHYAKEGRFTWADDGSLADEPIDRVVHTKSAGFERSNAEYARDRKAKRIKEQEAELNERVTAELNDLHDQIVNGPTADEINNLHTAMRTIEMQTAAAAAAKTMRSMAAAARSFEKVEPLLLSPRQLADLKAAMNPITSVAKLPHDYTVTERNEYDQKLLWTMRQEMELIKAGVMPSAAYANQYLQQPSAPEPDPPFPPPFTKPNATCPDCKGAGRRKRLLFGTAECLTCRGRGIV